MKKKIYLPIITTLVILGGYLTVGNNKNFFVANSAESTPIVSQTNNGLAIVHTDGSIVAPNNLDEMILESDLIIIGRPTQSIVESTPLIQRDSEGYVNEAISLTQFKVQKVLKGVPYSDTIAIGQQAAVITDSQTGKTFLQVFDNYQPLVKNAKYVLFLKKGLNNSPLYFPVGVYYGKVNTDGADPSEDKIPGLEFQSIRKAAIAKFKPIADGT